MLQILEESQGDLVAFRISGNVDKNDYDVMLPVLEDKIQKHGKIKVYAEVQDVEAYSLRALYEDIKFDLKHASDFSKAAIVGDQDWMDWLAKAARPFTTAEVKYFNFSQRKEAWLWIHEGNPPAGDRAPSPKSPA
ncbi:STAS/SEC14 domain-containing protein [Pontibacter diazotrophicus]|uniref:STAS/SEC14 domain-containing protein n=1 Tax=Pontibacter diazotrophicus TaxID=1400979 RepID=A0A3D8LIB1_9BACT|nr:STAS/SEC14 domain-containing protein [Pontibacter diazotrophicus]RDV16974.1 STAS/SEC14 domain-containing protein [Pontibacter diazotrophicus]